LPDLVRQRLDFVIATLEQRAGRLLKRRLIPAGCLGRGRDAERRHAEDGSDRNDERQGAATASEWRHPGIIT